MGQYTGRLAARLPWMFHARSSAPSGRSLFRRKLAWPILIIAVAIPVAFISGKLENDRLSAAEQFGQAVAVWNVQSGTVPTWLEEAAGHPILLVDLRRRLAMRQESEYPASVDVAMEDGSTGEARWRVVLSWPDQPTISLLLAFRDLEATPYLMSVGGEPNMTPGSTP